MISEFLFKPIIIDLDGEERTIIIYNVETSVSKVLDDNGKILTKDKTYVEVLDIETSILTGNPATEVIEITDEDKFISNLSDIENTEESFTSLETMYQMLNANLAFLKQRSISISSAFNAVKSIVKGPQKDNEGNLIIGGDSGGLAHIVFNTIKGDTLKLTDEEVNNVGQLVIDTIIQNINIDLENEKEVNGFIETLELKIIEGLPTSLRAGNITLNKDGIIKEIQSCKTNFLNDDDSTNDI